MQYYRVKVAILEETPKGQKYIKENYLVMAESVTDAETKTVQTLTGGPDFTVVSVVDSNIMRVID